MSMPTTTVFIAIPGVKANQKLIADVGLCTGLASF